jgi:hypothetical protein
MLDEILDDAGATIIASCGIALGRRRTSGLLIREPLFFRAG